jgi:hypothetical protein
MSYSAVLLFFFVPLVSLGQITTSELDLEKWEPPYSLDIPEGWGTERFLIPISFAPQIPYEGIEDIRFMPGWAKAESADYWSYAFLWYLSGPEKTTAKIVESNLQEYYTGLLSAILGDSMDSKSMTVKATIKKGKTQKGDIKTFFGSVNMFDYMAKKPIVLYCKVHLKSCEGQNNTFIFYELSPKNYSDKVWQSLDVLWTNFHCEKNLETK